MINSASSSRSPILQRPLDIEKEHDGEVSPYNITENLIEDMIGGARVGQTCPVVLVGHSLGGIIIKQVILTCNSMCRELNRAVSQMGVDLIEHFLGNCKGVFYYSTPHGGSTILDHGSPIWSMNKPLMELFKAQSAETARINQSFANVRTNNGIVTRAIGESKATKFGVRSTFLIAKVCHDHRYFVGHTSDSFSSYLKATFVGEHKGLCFAMQHFEAKAKVVNEASARQDVDQFYLANADHFEVCKPKDNKTCAIFKHLLEFVNDILKKGSMRITRVDPIRLSTADEDGATVGLVKRLSEHDDPNLQNAAAWASANGPIGLSIVEEDGAIVAAVRCLSGHNNLHLREAAAWAVDVLAHKDKSISMRIAKTDGSIVGLVECLSERTSQYLQEGAAWALCHLTGIDDDSINLSVAKEDGAILGLVKFLSLEYNPDLQEAAAWTLVHLTDTDNGSIRLSVAKEDGAIVGLVKCLSQSKMPSLQEAAIYMLCHLTDAEDHDSVKLRIAKEKGVIAGLKKCYKTYTRQSS